MGTVAIDIDLPDAAGASVWEISCLEKVVVSTGCSYYQEQQNQRDMQPRSGCRGCQTVLQKHNGMKFKFIDHFWLVSYFKVDLR